MRSSLVCRSFFLHTRCFSPLLKYENSYNIQLCFHYIHYCVYMFLLLCFGARKTNSGVRRNVSNRLKASLKRFNVDVDNWETLAQERDIWWSIIVDGVLHLSQIESRRLRIKDNFASLKPTITHPEASRRILFVLCVTHYSMHELDSLVTCAPINLRYSFTVIIFINFMDEQRKFRWLQCRGGCKCISQIVASFLLILKGKLSLYTCDSTN